MTLFFDGHMGRILMTGVVMVNILLMIEGVWY